MSDIDEPLKLKSKNTELIGLGIAMAARSLTAFFNKELKLSGLTIKQIYCLYAVKEYTGKSLSFIADKLYIDRSTMSRQIAGIKAYVKLNKSGDRRYLYPEVTEEGEAFLKRWMPKILELERGVGAFVEDKAEFVEFIHTFSSALAKKAI